MNFIEKLLKPNSDTSSRRFYGLIMIPLLYWGCIMLILSKVVVLMIIGVTIPFLIIMLAYFALKWKDAQSILTTLTRTNTTKTETETSKSEETINGTESTE